MLFVSQYCNDEEFKVFIMLNDFQLFSEGRKSFVDSVGEKRRHRPSLRTTHYLKTESDKKKRCHPPFQNDKLNTYFIGTPLGNVSNAPSMRPWL